jgi:hypothetical protein
LTFDELAPGTYLLGFQHLAIDTLNFRTPIHRVDVRTGGALVVPLAVPSMRSIVQKVCGAAAERDSLSLLVGSVRHARSDEAVPKAFISVRWAELFVTRAGLVRQTPTQDLFSDTEGWYAACVPAGIPITAHAEHESLRSGDVLVVMSTMAVLRRDLYIGAAERLILTAEDSVRRSGAINEGDRVVTSGAGSVEGVVRETNGKPIPDARVMVSSTRGETRTDSSGRFTLRSLPEGSHMLEVRALGFVPEEALVDIVAFRESSVNVTMVDLVGTLLDTMRVRARARLGEALRAGFDRRRKSGAGLFIDETVLDTLKAHSFADIARRIPGITFREGRGANDQFERQMFFSGSRGTPCPPTIYLDGIRLLDLVTDLDQIVNPATIRRVEVYQRGTTIPSDFSSNSNCGVLVVWTTPRLPGHR